MVQGYKYAIVNLSGCGFDSHARIRNILYFHILALVTRQARCQLAPTLHAVPREFGNKGATKLSK